MMPTEIDSELLKGLLAVTHTGLAADPPETPPVVVLRELALPLWRRGRIAEALACVELLERESEAGPVELQMRGFWALNTGDAQLARISFEALQEIAPDDPAGRLGLGHALLYAEEYQLAIEVFDGVTDSSSAPVAAATARALAKGSRPSELPIPPLPELPSQLSRILRLRPTHDAEWAAAEVRTTLASAVSCAPDVRCALTRYSLELTLEKPTGQPDSDELKAALHEFDEDGPIWWMAGIAARRSGLVELSAELFKAATGMAPLLAQAWAARGASLCELGELQDAERCLRTAVKVDDRAASAWTDLAGVQSLQEHWDNAATSLDRAIKAGVLSFETLYHRAVCRINAGDTARGLADLDDAVVRYPNHPNLAQAEALASGLRAPGSSDYVLGDEL